MTALDPLQASDRIRAEYRRYLQSTFPLRRPELASAFADQLDGRFALTRGPILQASPPYVAGCTVRELVSEGVLSDRFLRLRAESFPIDRPLHAHQERAIRKAVTGGRNLVVATGTGSGKTECFTLPILDGLLREAGEGTLGQPGVRALLLYPMNALANDQLKRLRTLLADFPAITFGRYVGETKPDQRSAEADFHVRYPNTDLLPNELISREVMQESPPHILLTNYAMLEYLLLRANDSTLFDGPTGGHWRYLALDEVHVYGGAQGTEVAILLRRLRDRINESQPRQIQCFGTSATLGRGVQDYPELVSFAEALFAEPFEWHDDDAERQDVVGSTHRPLVRGEVTGRFDDETIAQLRDAARAGAGPEDLTALVGRPTESGRSVPQTLLDVLAGDERVIALQQRLGTGSVDLQRLASETFPGPDGRRRLVDLVDLGVLARERPDDSPLLPARYHFFLRALEGAFACLRPGHDAREPQLLLTRHESCPSCVSHGADAAMFELGVCRRCGSEYIVGATEATPTGKRLIHASPLSANPIRVLLGDPLADDEDDEDQDAAGNASDKALAASLCPGCGELAESGTPKCGCSEQPVRVWIALNAKEDGALRRCIACGHRPNGDPVYRFQTGLDAPVSVIATDLYQEIPASQDPSLRDEVGQGRKLLAFSDSRQDAAFFAPFLERTYSRAVQRRLIAMALDAFGTEVPRLEDLVDPVVRTAERALVLDPDDGRVTNRRAVATWLTREVLAMDRRQSLEGTATADIRLAFPRGCGAPKGLTSLGFTADESLDLIRLLLDTVRTSGAIEVLEGVDVTTPEFAPRNREISIRGQGTACGVLSWFPTANLNGRLDILARVFARKGIDVEPKRVLIELWGMLSAASGPWAKLFATTTDRDGAPLWRLRAERFEVIRGTEAQAPLRCSRCAQLWWRTVADVCPSYRCDGTVEVVADVAALADEHYARLYGELEPIGMAVEEHTAQWNSEKASAIQDDFVSGRVNVLSCSTTFELGVDVGDVQAVLLRNVPPSPANYVQRAGRAGRRTSSAALVVTFAQRRSHDLTYFETPNRMVDGTIPPPRIVLDNAPIARRHLHSVAFAAFQREQGDHRAVKDFFLADNGPSSYDTFITWLRTRPPALGEAVARVIPTPLHGNLALDDWGWVDALVSVGGDEPSHGWLRRASEEILDDSNVIQGLIDEALDEKRIDRAAHFDRLQKSLVRRPLLNFLGSRNVLPKYGFPVDVVELSLARAGDATAGNLELSRDLELAISDYAPGAVTVAGKKLWRSIGLARRSDREWPEYGWAVCDSCQTFRHSLIEAAVSCPSCGSAEVSSQGQFVIPLYGFVGVSADRPGETRPPRRAMRETHFGSYRDTPPDLEPVTGLALSRRFSHQGRITVLNQGPMGRGFRVCQWCGFGQPIHETKPKKPHDRADRPGKTCNGNFAHLSLGHEYLTDVAELRVDTVVAAVDVRSALYALLEAAPELDVARDDIDGTIYYGEVGRPSFVLFDAVPGGRRQCAAPWSTSARTRRGRTRASWQLRVWRGDVVLQLSPRVPKPDIPRHAFSNVSVGGSRLAVD